MDRDLPVVDVLTTDELLSETTTSRRFGLRLLIAFAALAMLPAAVGLYGVLSYTMGQRTSELGIRMALGASRRDMLRLVLTEGMQPTAAGIGAGLAAAVASTRIMQSLLFRVSATDAQVFAAVTVLLILIALAACAGPA
jgi:putative ABC transport system permease protein